MNALTRFSHPSRNKNEQSNQVNSSLRYYFNIIVTLLSAR